MTLSMMFDDLLPLNQRSSKNKTLREIGIDCRKDCFDLKWFDSYPSTITYEINSLGFRDQEHSDLRKKVFAIGDSFTVGLGQPYEETWAVMLQNMIGEPIVKLSSNGASNDWMHAIFDRACDLEPKAIFVMLSYVHRQLIKGKDGSIEHLHVDEADAFDDEQWAEKMSERTRSHIDSMIQIAADAGFPVFFTAVPAFDYVHLSSDIRKELVQYNRLQRNTRTDVLKKANDLARDGLHFGKKTCEEIAKNLYIRYREEDR